MYENSNIVSLEQCFGTVSDMSSVYSSAITIVSHSGIHIYGQAYEH